MIIDMIIVFEVQKMDTICLRFFSVGAAEVYYKELYRLQVNKYRNSISLKTIPQDIFLRHNIRGSEGEQDTDSLFSP